MRLVMVALIAGAFSIGTTALAQTPYPDESGREQLCHPTRPLTRDELDVARDICNDGQQAGQAETSSVADADKPDAQASPPPGGDAASTAPGDGNAGDAGKP